MTTPSVAQFDLADRLETVLEAAGPDGVTPSTAARKLGINTVDARHTLDWMVANHFAHTSGNGFRAHYHAGRGR